MAESSPTTVLIRRPGRIVSDSQGRSVWADPVETAELELVSTQMLKVMLTSRDESDRKSIAEAANSATEGVLARDPRNGAFQIIDNDDLQAILDDNQGLPELRRPADVTLEPLRDYAEEEHLSLVSTQALRKVLRDDLPTDVVKKPGGKDGGAFDPYNSG